MSELEERCPPGYTDLLYDQAPTLFDPVGDYCYAPKGSGLKPVAARPPQRYPSGTRSSATRTTRTLATRRTSLTEASGGSGATGSTGQPTTTRTTSTVRSAPEPRQATPVVRSQPTAIIPPPPPPSEPEPVDLPPPSIPGDTDMTYYTFDPTGLNGGGSPSYPSGGGTGIEGISIGPGGISAEGSIFGIPIDATIPLPGGGGGSEPQSGNPPVPGSFAPSGTSAGCEFPRINVGGVCVDPTALPPGGKPAFTGPTPDMAQQNGYGQVVGGLYGEGRAPVVTVQTVRRCPPGYALGKDGVCYDNLSRNSPKRAWPMGQKPLLTPGDRAAIAKAKRAANAIARSRKSIKKTARALEKAGC